MKFVALFRNVNLGHDGSPSGAVLLEAFGGASAATSFQTNGTVVFEADDPDAVARRARACLGADGFRQHFAVRFMQDIASLVRSIPSADPAEGIYRLMVSFYDARNIPKLMIPLRSPDGLVEVPGISESWAWSACWKPRNMAGNVTGLLESLLDVPVTTRTVSTLERLVRKHDD